MLVSEYSESTWITHPKGWHERICERARNDLPIDSSIEELVCCEFQCVGHPEQQSMSPSIRRLRPRDGTVWNRTTSTRKDCQRSEPTWIGHVVYGTDLGSVNPLRFVPACGLLIGGLLSCVAREDRMTFDRLLGRARRSCRCHGQRMCIWLYCGDYWQDIRGTSRSSFGMRVRGGHRNQSARPFRLRFGCRRNAR